MFLYIFLASTRIYVQLFKCMRSVVSDGICSLYMCQNEQVLDELCTASFTGGKGRVRFPYKPVWGKPGVTVCTLLGIACHMRSTALGCVYSKRISRLLYTLPSHLY